MGLLYTALRRGGDWAFDSERRKSHDRWARAERENAQFVILDESEHEKRGSAASLNRAREKQASRGAYLDFKSKCEEIFK